MRERRHADWETPGASSCLGTTETEEVDGRPVNVRIKARPPADSLLTRLC